MSESKAELLINVAEEVHEDESISHASKYSLSSYVSNSTTGAKKKVVDTAMMNKHLSNKLNKVIILLDKSKNKNRYQNRIIVVC